MRPRSGDAPPQLTGAVGLSLLLHAAAAAIALLLPQSEVPAPSAPVYRVEIVAAPPGERREGVVSPAPAPPPRVEQPAPPPPSTQVKPTDMPLPSPPKPRPPARKPPPPATPTVAKEPAPQTETPAPAASGPTGGRGTDVVTVRTEGTEFPYPGYLENIVRQIALNFRPPRNVAARAEMMFLIRRDGSVSSIRFLSRSGNYAFDLEAQGAVEAAGNARAFGPLPDDFTDDVLPVIFSFDPRVLR